MADSLLAPMKGAQRTEVGGAIIDTSPAGTGRIKRVVYPAGFRWSSHMKSVVGGDHCMHAHVGFLARGRVHVEYADGVVEEFEAPQVVAIDPGHDAWVVGKEDAVLIEVDFERDTVERFGMTERRRRG